MIRFAKEEDFIGIQGIYAWYVENSTATFAYRVPLIEDMCEQWRQLHAHYPYLVYVEQGEVCGYAYGQPYRKKEAYQWDVEVSIYIHPAHCHKGIGSKLLGMLLDMYRIQGFYRVYSCITIPNAASMALHEHFGFQHVAIFHKAGYKNEQWLDVLWMEKELQMGDEKPKACLPVCKCSKLLSKKA